MKFTLRQLQVFLATAHHQNISKAAQTLAMSQSAASSSLAELENQFLIQLFDRVGKRLKLNSLGHSVRAQAQALLDQAKDLEHALLQQNQKSHLNIGATLTIGNYLAVHILADYLQDFPHSQVQLDVANTSTIVNKVANFELDLGLIEGEILDDRLQILPWIKDELVAFCSPQHPLAKRKKLTDKDILQQHWIVREQGSGTRQTFDRAMGGLLSELKVVLEFQHTEAIKRAVEANLGLGCISKVALKEAFSRGDLVPLTIPQRNFERQFYFILHKQKYRNESLQCWLDCCRKLYS